VRLADAIGDPARQALVEEAIERGIHLEVCPSSNVHTGAARSIAEHPIVALWRAGVSLSFHTDNRLMSRTTASQEANLLLAHTPLTVDDLVRMELQAVRHSFLGADVRAGAQRAIEAWRDATVIKPASG
jgi:adenosine deaminase